VLLPAVEVTRRGGPGITARELWEPLTVPTPTTTRLSGHLCHGCASDFESVRAWGPSLAERAFVRHLTATGRTDEAEQLRNALTDSNPPVITTFATRTAMAHRLGQPLPAGGATPWSWLRPPSTTDRLRRA
jgi:hypothetical protein